MAEGVRRRSVLAALAPLAAGCTAEAPAGPGAGPAPGAPAARDALVMVIRHAEGPYAGDFGEDEDGDPDAGSLAGRGHRRAEALPLLFGPARGARLPRPAALFAAGGAARSRQTVAALARDTGVRVRTDLGPGQEAALARAVLAAPMPVLVCWEHAGIPGLVRALGADRVLGVPAGWPARHDLVWTFTRRAGTWDFRELPQELLAGDA
ncbi:hypothetical protein LG634_11510 [Streptomyces bambusae]|uniref:hypothetical protein n=1 Tax=Streptomyces bambusae TaxID=1550616 RepID=UPI001CFE1957|nr:hypothetical protein [Streptomyces bambusae]MCB5165456.1 hypothetical protein [Streptomyces bambusae]